ncbi:glycosyltransferase family 4 protein [Pseudoalteromonas prydzensis]|uniref:glycosyltransferase family 4 protein n=1 Tax=Pseudoalteromonas prydzensis TaxID=182141 RepID=UPI003FD1C904
MKIFHIITGLNDGGAEGVLYRLCSNDKSNQHIVVSMIGPGKYAPLLHEAGVEVHCLNMPQGRITFSGLWSLFTLVRKLKPEIVQTWMYHADLVGGLIARIAGVKSVFWNIRHTTLEAGKSKRSTIFIAKLCAVLSRFIPQCIVCCANEALRVHSALGYKQSKMIVIGNGYNLNLFEPNEALATSLKDELNMDSKFILLGMVGRFDPQKDHLSLLRAINLVKNKNKNKNKTLDFKLVLVGRDMNSTNDILTHEIKRLNLESDVVLLNQRTDIPNIMNGLDVHILSSSFGEGFPNVLAEAMACGTPCITTDVGDASIIVGNTGWVVPPNNTKALANAITKAIEEKQAIDAYWENRRQLCRMRIVNHFSIETMIASYKKVWIEKSMYK